MTDTPTIAINGFGRIGRSVLRQALARGLKVAAINDIAPLSTCAYLFEYDSVFGPYPGEVVARDGALVIDGQAIAVTHSQDLEVDLRGVDVLMECTGRATTRDAAEAGLRAGAGRVLISGPSDVADVTIVLGANEAALNTQRVVSNASCTTNALAPLMRVLDAAFGIETGHMTTIHCYTGSQPTVDGFRSGPEERSRAAALSMVPTSTSAARLIDRILPDLAGRVTGCAVRVPTASVSAVDLTVLLREPATAEAVNGALGGAVDAAGGVIGTTQKPLVSQDLKGRSESIVMALPETTVLDRGLVRVFGWYDNEWGFSARMLDVAARMVL